MIRFLLHIFCLLPCLLLAGCIAADNDEVVERVRVGDRLPVFSVDVIDPEVSQTEHTVFNSQNLTGETVIVFFNTWCPDCQRELPRLNQYYLQHKDDKGFRMVAISRGEGKDVVARFWSEHELLIPYSAQEDNRIYELFASGIIPRIYFVSAQGVVTRIDVEHFGN